MTIENPMAPPHGTSRDGADAIGSWLAIQLAPPTHGGGAKAGISP